jgi:hypothetical protein
MAVWRQNDLAPLSVGQEFEPVPASWSATLWAGVLVLPTDVGAVTGTASFTQPAASWASAATETIPATGSWSQTAVWAATGVEELIAQATFGQSATWDATGSESIPGSAAFTQSATWQATGSQVIAGTAVFDQTAAGWRSTLEQTFDASAAFSQAPAAFSGQGAEEFAASAEFEQAPATWQASDAPLITGYGAWSQSAAWTADGAVEDVAPTVSGGSFGRYVRWDTPKKVLKPKTRPKVTPPTAVVQAAFGQQPATWQAQGTVVEPQDWLLGVGDTDEALLALV